MEAGGKAKQQQSLRSKGGADFTETETGSSDAHLLRNTRLRSKKGPRITETASHTCDTATVGGVRTFEAGLWYCLISAKVSSLMFASLRFSLRS